MVLAPKGVALFGVKHFKVFCLPDLILPIGAKGLQRHTMMCCTLSSANTIGAKQCAALHKQFAALHNSS
jgi:hypothetical protein